MTNAHRVGARRALLSAVILLGPLVAPVRTPAAAAPPADAAAAVPLVVVHVAGAGRVLDDVDHLLAAANRPELAGLLRGLLVLAGDLKGVDRERPLGVMVVLPQEKGMPPTAVGYLPVTSAEDLLRTIRVGPVTTRPVEGTADRYEIIGPDRTLHLRMAGRYAFVGLNAAAVAQRLPDPVAVAQHLTPRYDVALSLRLANVPENMKTLVLDFLRASAEPELQRREGESDAQFRFRRALGLSQLAALEQLLLEGRELTLGWSLSRDQAPLALEAVVEAQAGSPLARSLHHLGNRASAFGRSLDPSAPLSLSVSLVLDERGQLLLQQGLKAAQESVINEDGAEPAGRLAPVFESLAATAARGRVDLFAQLVGRPPEPRVLVGGLRVADSRSLADGLSAAWETEAAAHRGTVLHRVVGNAAHWPLPRIGGRNDALLIGADAQTLWFAVGGDSALPALTAAMDRLAEPHAAAEPEASPLPLRLIAHAGAWADLAADGAEAENSQTLVRKAFAEGDDLLRMELRPTENGVRLRVEMEEGFVRLIGLAVVQAWERRGR